MLTTRRSAPSPVTISVFAQLAGAGVIDHHDRAAVPAGLHHQVGEAALAECGDVDLHRLGQLGLGRDPDRDGLLGLRPGHRGQSCGLPTLTTSAATVSTVRPRRAYASIFGASYCRPRRRTGLELLDRGEAPLLLAPVRHREVGDVVRRRPLAAALDRHRADAGPWSAPSCRWRPVSPAPPSADCSFHLQLDQPVQFQRVLHRELAGARLDEAAAIIAIASSSVMPRLIR